METKNIVMTKYQAKRMGTPELEGKTITCEMPTKEEVRAGRPANVATKVYYGKCYIGGCMDINE